MAEQPSTLVISTLERARIATIEGEIDLATADGFEHALIEALAAGDLVIDLSGCSFLDSSGVRALVTATRAAERLDRALALVHPAGPARRILELTGITETVTSFDGRDQALRSLDSIRPHPPERNR